MSEGSSSRGGCSLNARLRRAEAAKKPTTEHIAVAGRGEGRPRGATHNLILAKDAQQVTVRDRVQALLHSQGKEHSVQFSSVQSLSRVRLFATPWTAALHASLSITNSWSSLKLMSIESVMPSSHPILCCPLFLLPPIPPSIRVFSKESTLCMRWPKYWSFQL